jgi:predicted ATP-dependent serine protease
MIVRYHIKGHTLNARHVFIVHAGIGKSTLVIQAASHLHRASGMEDTDDATSDTHEVIYISGEESPEQIAMRAQRLALDVSHVSLICDVDVDGAGESVIYVTFIYMVFI